jgi:hypothetical protein
MRAAKMCFSKPDWRIGNAAEARSDRLFAPLAVASTAIWPIQGKKAEKSLEVSACGG